MRQSAVDQLEVLGGSLVEDKNIVLEPENSPGFIPLFASRHAMM